MLVSQLLSLKWKMWLIKKPFLSTACPIGYSSSLDNVKPVPRLQNSDQCIFIWDAKIFYDIVKFCLNEPFSLRMYMKMRLCLKVAFWVAVYEGGMEMSVTYPSHIPCKSIRVFLFSISDITSCLASHLSSTPSWPFTVHFPHSVQMNRLQVRDSASCLASSTSGPCYHLQPLMEKQTLPMGWVSCYL